MNSLSYKFLAALGKQVEMNLLDFVEVVSEQMEEYDGKFRYYRRSRTEVVFFVSSDLQLISLLFDVSPCRS